MNIFQYYTRAIRLKRNAVKNIDAGIVFIAYQGEPSLMTWQRHIVMTSFPVLHHVIRNFTGLHVSVCDKKNSISYTRHAWDRQCMCLPWTCKFY